MYVYIYIHTYICLYTYICIYTYICVYIYIRIDRDIRICRDMYTYVYVYIYICMCICVYTRVYICIYINMYVYIYIYKCLYMYPHIRILCTYRWLTPHTMILTYEDRLSKGPYSLSLSNWGLGRDLFHPKNIHPIKPCCNPNIPLQLKGFWFHVCILFLKLGDSLWLQEHGAPVRIQRSCPACPEVRASVITFRICPNSKRKHGGCLKICIPRVLLLMTYSSSWDAHSIKCPNKSHWEPQLASALVISNMVTKNILQSISFSYRLLFPS